MDTDTATNSGNVFLLFFIHPRRVSVPQCHTVQTEGWVLLFIIKTLCKQAYALRLTESETKVVIKVNQKLQHHFAHIRG